jgi:hypothetical protein
VPIVGYTLLAAVNFNQMEAELKEILKKDPKAKYRLRYVDYEEGMWTLPLELKDNRIENFANDKSLDKVEIRFSNGSKLVLSA